MKNDTNQQSEPVVQDTAFWLKPIQDALGARCEIIKLLEAWVSIKERRANPQRSDEWEKMCLSL